MKHRMNKHRENKNAKIWLVLGMLATVALLVAFWTAISAPSQPRYFPGGYFPGDIELYYTAKTVISTINIAILIILLITYIGIYRKTKSEFTIGLIIFSIVLLLNVLASSPLVIQGFGFRLLGLGPFAMLPDLFTCVALIILLYLSVKY
jgi:uncharacterized membrane protein